MNGLAETNSTHIFLFFESVLKLTKRQPTLECYFKNAGTRGNEKGEFPGNSPIFRNSGNSPAILRSRGTGNMQRSKGERIG